MKSKDDLEEGIIELSILLVLYYTGCWNFFKGYIRPL